MKVIEILKKLVAFETTKENVSEREKCLDYIDNLLLKQNKDIKIKKFNVKNNPSRIYLLNSSKKIKLIFNGHIDVVGGKKTQFKLKIEKDKIYGRGTYDMKGAIAVYIELFNNYYELMKKKNVSLMIVSDEEFSGEHGTHNILKHLLKKGYTIDYCINGEPTDLEIVKEAKGGVFLKLEIIGQAAHSARPWLGRNPNYDYIELMKMINKLFPPLEKEEWKTSVEVTDIKSVGYGENSIPQKIIVSIDIRYVKNDEIKIYKLLNFIKKNKNIKITEKSEYNPIFYKRISKYTKILKQAIIKNNLNFKFRKGFGTSDLRYFSRYQIFGVGFGLVGSGAHSNNEYVYTDSLSKYKKILLEFINKI